MTEGTQLTPATELPPESLELTEAQFDLDRAAYKSNEDVELKGDIKLAVDIDNALREMVPEKTTLQAGEAKSEFDRPEPTAELDGKGEGRSAEEDGGPKTEDREGQVASGEEIPATPINTPGG
jgi:hypothetical protein